MRVFPADDTAPRDVFIRTAQVLVEEQLRSLTYILRVAVPPSFYLMSALSGAFLCPCHPAQHLAPRHLGLVE